MYSTLLLMQGLGLVHLKSYDIKNPEVLGLLAELEDMYLHTYDIENTNTLYDDKEKYTGYYISDEFRDIIIGMGDKHSGMAEYSRSHGIKPTHYKGDNKLEYTKRYNDINDRFKIELGLRDNALSQYYPPKGYIGWHSNADASAHNLLFTWSETGDGYFKYIDPITNETIIMPDKKGWSLKAGYFGRYGSDSVIYHTAQTNCKRLTFSYTLGHDLEYWRDCIDYISNK